ncbi:MAG: PKD-like domain-containing protein, partial [Flavobacteriales bacterium]
GCPSASATVTVTITPSPVVSYTGITSICSGQPLALALSSNVGATSYSWTVVQSGVSGATNSGAPTTSITDVLFLSGSSAGTATYTVSPTANGCPGLPLNIVVTVSPTNTAGPPSANPVICLGLPMTPNVSISTSGATGIGIPSNIPPGTTATWSGNVITLSGTPTAVGTYNYTIPLTGGCGTVSATGTITVVPANTVSAPSYNPTLCANNPLNPVITYATTGATGIGPAVNLPAGLTASWNNGVITISGTPTVSGTFSYSIPLTGGCGVLSALGTIVVNPIPSVSANALSFSVCAGPTLADASAPAITLTSPQAGTTYTWSLFTGTVPSGTPVQTGSGTPNYLFTNASCTDVNYVYQVTPTLNGCPGAPINIAVLVRPKPTSTFTVSPNPLCTNQTATVTYTGFSCPGSTYNWTWPSGASIVSGSGSGPYVLSFNSAGTYDIKLQVVGPSALGSCTSTQTTVNLVVNQAPVVNVLAASSICSGQATSLSLTSTPAGATFSWTQSAVGVAGASNGSGAAITQILSTTGATAGTVTYSITPTLGNCMGSTVASVVTVNPNVTPTFAAVGPYCSGATIPALPTTSNEG